MALRKADGPLTVQLPTAAADRPAWPGVGAIAVVGFVIGVAWPHLVGVRPGPSVPEGAGGPVASANTGSASSASGANPPLPAAGPGTGGILATGSARAASPAAALLSAPASPSSGPAGVARVSVAHGVVFACKTTGGETRKGAECGSVPALDGLVVPRLRKLAECPDAAASSGILRLNVRADFGRGIVSVALGRDKSLATGQSLLACAKPLLASVNLDGVAHENARYSLSYAVTFVSSAPSSAAASLPAAIAEEPAAAPDPVTPPAATATAAGATPAAAPLGDATAEVEWEVALVRDTPKTGKVVARLQRGTSVRVGPGKDGWYPVKFGESFGEDGWLYRGAIGR